MDEGLKETVVDGVNSNDSIINNYVNDIEQNDINNMEPNSSMEEEELGNKQESLLGNENKDYMDFEIYTIFSITFILIIFFGVLYYIYKHKKNVLE